MFKLSEIVTVPFNFNNSEKSSIYWAKTYSTGRPQTQMGKKVKPQYLIPEFCFWWLGTDTHMWQDYTS